MDVFQSARRLRKLLLVVIAGGMAWSAISAYQWMQINKQREPLWNRYDQDPAAVLTEMGLGDGVHDVNIPRPEPGRVYERVFAGLLLAACGVLIWRVRWGRRLRRVNGKWMEEVDLGVGESAATPMELRHPPASRKANIFWMALFGGIALLTYGYLFEENGWAAIPVCAMATGLAIFVAHTLTVTMTRRVRTNGEGLLDVNFFGSKRIPWSEVASMVETDVAQERKKRWRQTRRPGDPLSEPGAPMGPVIVFLVKDGQGAEILRLQEDLYPREIFKQTLERIGKHLEGCSLKGDTPRNR